MAPASPSRWEGLDPMLRISVDPEFAKQLASQYSLCNNCHNLDVENYPLAQTVDVNGVRKRTAVLEHFHFSDLKFKSCGYCDLICRAIRAFYPKYYLSAELYCSVRLQTITLTEDEPILITIGVRSESDGKFIDQGIEIFRDPGPKLDTIPAIGCAKALPKQNKIDGELEFIRECIKDCLEKHEICSPLTFPTIKSSHPPLPTRILDLTVYQSSTTDIDAPVRLVVTNLKTRGPYAALSHCWGKKPIPLRLLNDNIIKLQSQIPLSSLPATHVDAILLSRRLGLSYLWIDTLCIIQDNEEDFKRECPRMHSVYHNAHITIAATKSSSHEMHFLSPQNPEYVSKRVAFYGPKKQVVRFPDALAGLTIGLPRGPRTRLNATMLNVRRTQRAVKKSSLDTGHHASSRSASEHVTGPLNDRAWTLQERALARRIVHFTEEGICWECGCEMRLPDGRRWQDSWGHIAQWSKVESAKKLADMAASLPIVKLGIEMGGLAALWLFWRRMLKDYTARSITHRSDWLPALSGLASGAVRMYPGHLMQHHYLAGLWSYRLVEDLCWDPAGFRGSDRGAQTEPCVLPEEKDLPTWSWISVNQPISYAWGGGTGTWKPEAIAIHAKVDLKDPNGPNPFGEVTGGRVTLEGPVMRARLKYHKPVGGYTMARVDFDGTSASHDLIPDNPLMFEEYMEGGEKKATFRRARMGAKEEVRGLTSDQIDYIQQEIYKNGESSGGFEIQYEKTPNGKPIRRVWRRGEGETSSTGEASVLCIKLGTWSPQTSEFEIGDIPQYFVLVLARSSRIKHAYQRLGFLNKDYSGVETRWDSKKMTTVNFWKGVPKRKVMII